MPWYVALEGGEGSGKSTQAKRLARRLDAVLTREPGGTTLGAELRRLLLAPDLPEVSARAEALLMAADRAEHMVRVVEPALGGGRHVVSDRSVYSSLAYQGGARGLGIDAIRSLNRFALDDRLPDLIVLLAVPPDVAAGRLSGIPDKLEAAGRRFHQTVAATYDQLAASEPDRFVVIPGEGSPQQIHQKIWAAVTTRLGAP